MGRQTSKSQSQTIVSIPRSASCKLCAFVEPLNQGTMGSEKEALVVVVQAAASMTRHIRFHMAKTMAVSAGRAMRAR